MEFDDLCRDIARSKKGATEKTFILRSVNSLFYSLLLL